MSGKLRIGAVSYLNTLPLVHGLRQGLGSDRIALSYEVPAVLADQMRAGRLDVALMPVIELASMPHLEVVPGLGIVTEGDARSVLLISKVPPQQLRRVALDVESRSSNALTRVLCAEIWRCRPEFRPASADLAGALEGVDAAVRIGDKALFDEIPAGLHVIDLGRTWTDATGLPFVFAAWFTRAGGIDREIYRILHESRRRGSGAIDAIAEEYVFHGRRDPQLARDYLNRNIRFRLGAREVQSMRLFFALAAEHGVIDRAPLVTLAFGQDTSCYREPAGLGAPYPADEVPHA